VLGRNFSFLSLCLLTFVAEVVSRKASAAELLTHCLSDRRIGLRKRAKATQICHILYMPLVVSGHRKGWKVTSATPENRLPRAARPEAVSEQNFFFGKRKRTTMDAMHYPTEWVEERQVPSPSHLLPRWDEMRAGTLMRTKPASVGGFS
jgi:hypothetical protein